MISNRKRATESFIVSIAGQSTMPTSGQYYNSSTGNVSLANGQLGIVSASHWGTTAMNNFVDNSPTLAEAPVIAIYQGTSASASVATASATYPLSVRSFEKTNNIDGRNKGIVVTKQAFRGAKNSLWTVGVISSSTVGEINVLDETEYRLTVAFNSRRSDEHLSTGNQVASLPLTLTTPNFTNLGMSDLLARDYIATHFGYKINVNSAAFLRSNQFQGNDPVIAFAVGLANSGPGGAAAGTEIAGLNAGDTLAVVTIDGIDRSIVVTQEILDTLDAASAASGFTHIFKIDTANAGTATGGTATGLFIMGLDEKLAYVDRIPQIKVRLRVALRSGFDYLTVNNTEEVNPDEGQGYSRQLDLLYQETQGQRKYAQRHVEDPVINYPSPIVDGQQYVVYNILHGRSEQVDTTNVVYSPYREIVCIPRYSTGTTTNPLIATFDTWFNTWLGATGNPSIVSVV
jgi:hypothetical protein